MPDSIKISVLYLAEKADENHSTVSTPPIAYSAKKLNRQSLEYSVLPNLFYIILPDLEDEILASVSKATNYSLQIFPVLQVSTEVPQLCYSAPKT